MQLLDSEQMQEMGMPTLDYTVGMDNAISFAFTWEEPTDKFIQTSAEKHSREFAFTVQTVKSHFS